MRKDAPLAEKDVIRAEDLWDKPLIISRQGNSRDRIPQWLKKEPSELNIAAYYSLIYNASLMTEEGMGYTLTLDKLVNVSGDSGLCFRPMEPRLEVDIHLVWKNTRCFPRRPRCSWPVCGR